MTNLRVLLVDDESLARRGLRLRLDKMENIEIIGECRNGREAIAAIRELEPDLVFLDIHMPGVDGFGVIRALQCDAMPMVIFVTAFDQYALHAFDVHAVDYVLKPVENDRLREAVDRARQRLRIADGENAKRRLIELLARFTGESERIIDTVAESGDISLIKRYPEKIAIRNGGTTTLIPVVEIDWIDAAGDYMCIHANGATHIMRTTMKELESLLSPRVFQRIHRSTIVNVVKIESLHTRASGDYFVNLQNGTRLKMGRGYKSKIKTLKSFGH